MKVIILSTIILLLLVFGLVLFAFENGWYAKCNISLNKYNYKIKNGVLYLSRSSRDRTLKIFDCEMVKSIVVKDYALLDVPTVEIYSIEQ